MLMVLVQFGLQIAVMESAHTAAALIKNKVFDAAHSLPWSLAIGNIGETLENFKASDGNVDEPNAEKLQILMRIGYNKRRLAQTVSLMGDIWVDNQRG